MSRASSSGMDWGEIRTRLGMEEASSTKEVRDNYDAYLASEEWKVCRRFALAFYDHRCALCNAHENLEVHHRSYAHLYEETLTDLIVLCRRCHGLFHKDRKADA